MTDRAPPPECQAPEGTRAPERRDFGLQMLRLARGWRNVVDGHLRDFCVTSATWRALFHLGERDGSLRPSELSEALEMERPSLTQLLDRLEAAGLVERRADPGDHRCKIVVLTAAGREIHHRTVQVSGLTAARLLHDVSDAEMAVVLSVLERVSRNIAEASAELGRTRPKRG